MNIPEGPKGVVNALMLTSADLEASLQFWTLLGFRVAMRHEFPIPWVTITDGALLIMLRQTDEAILSQNFFADNAQALAAEFADAGVTFTEEPSPADMVKRWLFRAPDGQRFAIVQNMAGLQQPSGLSMLQLYPHRMAESEAYANQVCGMFGELAYPVTDLEESIAFREKIGFRVLSKYSAPRPWAILTNGNAVIGLHQTADFSFPAITYFAVDMSAKIQALREKGVPNISERGGPGNVQIVTPEQQHLFLFSLGM